MPEQLEIEGLTPPEPTLEFVTKDIIVNEPVVVVERCWLRYVPEHEEFMLFIKAPLIEAWVKDASQGRQEYRMWYGKEIEVHSILGNLPLFNGVVWLGSQLLEGNQINLLPFLMIGIGTGIDIPVGKFSQSSQNHIWLEGIKYIIPELYLTHMAANLNTSLKFLVEVTNRKVA